MPTPEKMGLVIYDSKGQRYDEEQIAIILAELESRVTNPPTAVPDVQGELATAALIAIPDSLPMGPYQTVDRSSPHYKAGWNACRRAMLAALEEMLGGPNP